MSGRYMKMNETYFRQFDSKIGYDGDIIHGGKISTEVRIMKGLGFFLYMFLASLPIAYILIKISSMFFGKII